MSSEFVASLSSPNLRQLNYHTEFDLTHSQHQFKSSSTALIAITFILFIGYSVAKFIANRKTGHGTDVKLPLGEFKLIYRNQVKCPF